MGKTGLFFDPSEISALRSRAATMMRPQRDALIAYADAHLGDDPPEALSGGYERRGDAIQDPFLAYTLAFCTLGVITGEARYRQAGKRWALALAGMKDWVGILGDNGKCANCGYPEGWGVTALAVAYDFLHADLDEGERRLLRDKIAAVCSGLYHGTLDGEWWTGAYLHHDTWIPIGGLGVGAMAILDDVPEAERWAERAREALGEALDWLADDGAWPEGPCGWAFAMISAVPFWEAYRRRFPARAQAFLLNPWLMRTASFRLSSRTPDGRFLGFGDCNPHGGYQENAREAAPTLRWLAARYGDEKAQWLAAREWDKNPNPYTASWEILFTDPGVTEFAPGDDDLGELFANQGMAFARTGWGADATVIAFRCDSLLGRRAASLYRPGSEGRFNNSTTHVHADAGGFGVWSRGDFAITLPRYGQNASAASNTLIVDGQGQYEKFAPDHLGRPDGKITSFFAAPGGAVFTGEAARAYPALLDRFQRTIVLADPGVVFIIDDIAAPAPVDLATRFHVDADARLDLGADGFTATINERRTVLRLATPRGAALSDLTDEHNLGVTVSLGDRRTEAALVAAVVPSISTGAPVSIDTPGPRSFVIQVLGAEVLAAFADNNGSAEVPGILSASARLAVVTRRGKTLQSLLAAEATRVVVDGSVLLQASKPVTVALRDGAITVLAPEPAEVRIGKKKIRVPAGTTRREV